MKLTMFTKPNLNFGFLSLNVRGIRSFEKRKALFHWCIKDKADIIFLQETYSTPEVENVWKSQWRGELFFSHGSEHSRGVLILVKEGLDCHGTKQILNQFSSSFKGPSICGSGEALLYLERFK